MALPGLLDVGEAVTLADLLLALGTLCLWIGALILAALCVMIVKTVLWPLNKFVSTVTFGVVGSVPGEHAVEQFFTHLLGEAAHGVDAAAGRFWHGLKKLVVGVADEIFGLAVLSGYLWWWAQTKLPGIIWHRFIKLIHAGNGVATAIAKQALAEAKAAKAYAKAQIAGINTDLRAINTTIDEVLQPEIKTARDLAGEAENLAQNAWDWIKSQKYLAVTGAFIAAVTAALSAIGLDWLFCKQNPISSSKTPCNAWQDLADLLGLALAIEAALNFDDLVHTAQDAAEVAATGIMDVFGLSQPPPS